MTRRPRGPVERWMFRMALGGVLLWCGVILLRGTAPEWREPAAFLLGVAPNFGAAWLGYGLCAGSYPALGRGPLPPFLRLLLALGIFGALAASEWVHDRFLDAPFDPWDLAASLLALGIALAVHTVVAKKDPD